MSFITPRRFVSVACLLLISTIAQSQTRGEEPPSGAAMYHGVQCDGFYSNHLQGIAVDGQGAIFWSFTTTLVRTDSQGNIAKTIDVKNHHGDLTYVDGKLYVAVNFGAFNNPQGKADSWVYVYQADDLSLLAKHEVQEVIYGAGGMAHDQGQFFVVGGLPSDINENYIYEYDSDFQFVKRHEIASGQTHLGIQTAEYADGHWWFGCYGNPQQLVVTDESFTVTGRYDFNCSYGIAAISSGKCLVASGTAVQGKGQTGAVHLAIPDDKLGLKRLTTN